MIDTKNKWPIGDSEMAELIRTKNWAKTPLGPIEDWPQSLRASVDLILPCEFPMIILWGDDLIQIYNDGYRAIMADKHPKGMGQSTRECWPEVWEFTEPIYKRVGGGETVTFEDQHLRLDREGDLEDAWFDLSFSPLHDGTGVISGVLVAVAETTEHVKADAERKQAEKNLRNSEKRFRTMMEQSPLSIQIFDAKGRTLAVNSAWERLWSASREEVTDYNILRDEQLKATGLINHIRNAFDGEVVRLPATYYDPADIGKPGRARWIEGYVYPLISRDGETFEVAMMHHDITEHKHNERSNALLAAIIDGSNDAIISKDLNGVITSWNAGAERMFGYTSEEAIGRSIMMLIPAEQYDEETEILEQLRQGKGVDYFETIRLHKDGTPMNVSLTISPIRDSTGQVVGASKIARDITKRKETEEKLQELNETLEKRVKERTAELQSYQYQLRSLVSQLNKAEEKERHRLAAELHDNLGQMLAVAKMNLDSVEKTRLFDDIANEIIDATDLVDDAITYTRELMSELKPPPAFDRGEDIGETLTWVAKKMEAHGLKVTIRDDEQPKPLSEEIRATLYQCVRELLYNVVKHAGVREAGLVLSRDDGVVRVTVEDEGKGFDPEGKDLIPDEEGGFGLFNVRERIDLLGGSLEVVSEPGEGTKATLYAPVKEKGALHVVVRNGAEPEPSAKK